MSSRPIHKLCSWIYLGNTYDKIHAWMDYPSKRLKRKHRKERHNFECPDWAIRRYGNGAKNAVRLHVIQDHFRYMVFLGLPVMLMLRILWLILKAVGRILGKIFLRDSN